MIIPVTCERCGKNKRADDGRMLYVALGWRRGKRIVCPECLEGEKIMQQLDETVNGWDDLDVPF